MATAATRFASGWDDYSDAMLLDLATRGACDCAAEAAALELEARHHHTEASTTARPALTTGDDRTHRGAA